MLSEALWGSEVIWQLGVCNGWVWGWPAGSGWCSWDATAFCSVGGGLVSWAKVAAVSFCGDQFVVVGLIGLAMDIVAAGMRTGDSELV